MLNGDKSQQENLWFIKVAQYFLYVKCPIQPCLLFCGQDQALEYMKAVYSQPHPELMDMWCCLQCFCREPATLQQSHSTQNPDRLFLNCSKKKCGFFRWADQPLGPKYWTWFHDHPPQKSRSTC